jgi:hypothetical protein
MSDRRRRRSAVTLDGDNGEDNDNDGWVIVGVRWKSGKFGMWL